ncbi:helix-turn-helix domain-containing protein [Moraxellaceae bacterium AER2_44_116]|nr:helix-turn-helix domain-containing protein [Moraxellaceae bacterium AER2_44_116]
MTAAKGYWSTKDLCHRFRCTRCTINRWMRRDKLPFPKPKIMATGSQNLWSIDDVQKWEIECVISQNPELANQAA